MVTRFLTTVGVVLVVLGGWVVWTTTSDLLAADDPAPSAEHPFLVGETEDTSSGIALPAGGFVDPDDIDQDGRAGRTDDGSDLSLPDELAPDHLYIPALGVAAPVDDGRVVDGKMEVPGEVGRTSRYVDGATPGDDRGTVLLAGHVNTRQQGQGVFARLHQASAGMRVVVTDADATPYEYVVTGLTNVDKQSLPSEIFSDSGAPRLTLVTCGGELLPLPSGGRTHANNVIATALPVRT